MSEERKMVRRVLSISIILMMGLFVAVSLSWSLWAGIAITTIGALLWLFGAFFAISIIPADDYSKYAKRYEDEINQK